MDIFPRTIEEFRASSAKCVDIFNQFAERYTLENKACADHIGFKCASSEVFEDMRNMLEKEAEYIYQSIISARRIAIVKLRQPLETLLGPVYFLELSDQKPDMSQKNGFDHIEVYPVHISLDQLVGHIEAQGIKGEASIKPHHTTHNFSVEGSFIVKVEPEALMEKIVRTEIQK